MSVGLDDLRLVIQDKKAFTSLDEFPAVCKTFLKFLPSLTRIVSPYQKNYIFYQYPQSQGSGITRPINSDLFVESSAEFAKLAERFMEFLTDLKRHQAKLADRNGPKEFVESHAISKFVYTVQQSIGSIGDSFTQQNQSRKRVGDIFENFVRLIMRDMGLECQPRTITLPVPNFSGYKMRYQLDLVFSREKAILTSETAHIHPSEIVGSVKTTSKDRMDKLFLDKFLLKKLLGRDVPVIGIFLHDVQRSQRGNSPFAVNPTFKSGHFLGYTVALIALDGVYYIDPRPEMLTHIKLREQIHRFEQFITKDVWTLSGK